jgi:hypothetical protein
MLIWSCAISGTPSEVLWLASVGFESSGTGQIRNERVPHLVSPGTTGSRAITGAKTTKYGVAVCVGAHQIFSCFGDILF